MEMANMAPFSVASLLFALVLSAHAELLHPIIPAAACKSGGRHYKINTALVTIELADSALKNHLIYYQQSAQCSKCDLIPIARIQDRKCRFRVDSRWDTRLEIRQVATVDKSVVIKKPSKTCSESSLTMLYEEGGNYSLYIQSDGSNITCTMALVNDPADPFLSIYAALAILLCLIILWNAGVFLYRRGYFHRIFCFWSTENMMSDLGTPTNVSQNDGTFGDERNKVEVKERLKSLDTFRGITICFSIIGDYSGGQYGGQFTFIGHSRWNGLALSDLVFPWFIFIMGSAMVFSFQSQLRKNIPKWKIFLRIVKRSCLLFVLGLVINSDGKHGVDLDTFRIPGVLQRFAGTYLITASVFLFTVKPHNPQQFSKWMAVRDITGYWVEWIVQLCLVTLHLALTFAMPVPGCPRGYLGPGGYDQGGAYFNCTGGAAGYIDRIIFGDAHIYQHPTSTEIYHQSVPYDPEGLLGTLNSCFLCFLGLQAGKIIFIHNDWIKRCRRFFVWSILLGGLALLLCKASINDGWIPINKNLWSLSFVLALGGMAFFLLMICYILIDVYKVWNGAPFYYAGMNAIALYCGHEFFSGRFPVNFIIPETHGAQLALNMWGAAFWVLVSIYFFYKDVFISV